MPRKLSATGAAAVIILTTASVSAPSASYGPWPWEVDWRHTAAWQYPFSKQRHYFAGCWKTYRVVTPEGVSWQRMYICR